MFNELNENMYNSYIWQIMFNELNENLLVIVKCIRSGNLLKEEGGGEGNLLRAIRSTWINL